MVLSYAFLVSAENKGMIHFTFDEGEGGICKDVFGGYTSILKSEKGQLPLWSNGIYGKALAFEPASQNYLVMSEDINRFFVGSQGLTVMAWIKPTKAIPHGEVVNCKTDTGNTGFRLYIDNRDLTLEIGDGKRSYLVKTSGMIFMSDFTDTWLHIAGTFNGRVLRLFINGELIGENGLSHDAHLESGYGLLTIGNYCGTKGAYAFDGLIDEVKIFNFAVSSDEIINYL